MDDILLLDLFSPLQGLQLIFSGISYYIPFLDLLKMGTSLDELRCFDEDIRIMGYKTKQQAMAMFIVNKNMYKVLTNIFTQSEKMYKQYERTNVMPKNIQAEQKRKERISELIKFNISSLNSNNIDYIFGNLYPIITKDMRHCQYLVNLILKNMTRDRKQIGVYAKLIKECSQISCDQFMFIQQSSITDANPLIDYITRTLTQKSARLIDLLETEQILAQKSDLRAYLIAQVKLVAELRKQNVLTNQQTKLYIGKLMKQFVYGYDRNVDKRIKKITFSYYFEAVIQMIDQLGTTFEQLDDSQPLVHNTKKPLSKSPFYMWVQTKLLKISYREYNVDIQSFKQNYQHLGSEEIIKSLSTIQKHLLNKVQNIEVIKQKLQKLMNRRKNKWHNAKQSKDQKIDANIVVDIRMSELLNKIARIQSYYLQYAEQGLQRILFHQFDTTQMQEKNECLRKREKSLRNAMSSKLKSKLLYITKNYDENLWMASYLKLVADDRKSKIQARISFFHFLLQNFQQSCEQTFPVFWHRYLDQICKLAYQLPYFTSSLAFILAIFISSKPTNKPNYTIFYKQNNPIIMQIFQKMFHYSEDVEILKQIPEPDCRIKNLL